MRRRPQLRSGPRAIASVVVAVLLPAAGGARRCGPSVPALLRHRSGDGEEPMTHEL
ncbi:hypothetical protein [Streptomyces sp. NPDC019890]|uniref:hypothetical protein n=1 Tax=Streptomyces sp. NPDC019890 TaxID=3365064 RepID=UPI00384B8E53